MSLTQRYVSATASGGSGTEGDPWDLDTALSSAVAGDVLNVKKGTYTVTSTKSPTNDGSPGSPIIMRGYNNTIGDAWGSRTNGGLLDTGNMPVLSLTADTTLLDAVNDNYWIFESLRFVGNHGTSNRTALATGYYSSVVNCSFEELRIYLNRYARAVDCDLVKVDALGQCLTYGFGNIDVYGCRISSALAEGVAGGGPTGGQQARFMYCLVHDCGTHGIQFKRPSYNGHAIVGCTIANCGGSAIYISQSTERYPMQIVNNMITGCAAPITNPDSAYPQPIFSGYNRIRDCTSGSTGITFYWDGTDVTTDLGTGDTQDYVDAANGDYRLIRSSPARAAGLFGWNDIGALRYAPETWDGVERERSKVAQVDSSDTELLECPFGGKVLITMLQIGNIDGTSAATVDLKLSRNGAAAVTIAKGISIAAGESRTIYSTELERLVLMDNGTPDVLYAVASAQNDLSAVISYSETAR